MPLQGAAGNHAGTLAGLEAQRQRLKRVLPDGQLQNQQILHLEGHHGLNALPLIEAADASEREPLSDVIPLCLAEVRHAIQHEHARSREDVLARRCRLAMVDAGEAERLQPLVDQVLNQTDGSPAVAFGG